jgi:hypothetical protein
MQFVRYIQQQQVNAYQTLDDLYCVLATYDADGDYSVPAFKGPVVGVFNYANTGEVNGPSQSANGTVLCAREVNTTRPAQLAVAPCFLPNIAAGPYWVLAVGYESEAMTWAVVSGGQPTVELDDGCTTSTDSINGSGLWIFSRSQVRISEKHHCVLWKFFFFPCQFSSVLTIVTNISGYVGR